MKRKFKNLCDLAGKTYDELMSDSTLNLSYRDLTEIPMEVFDLEHISWLFLIKNNIEHIPEDIKRMRSLTWIDIRENKLTNVDNLFNCPAINDITASRNKISQISENVVNCETLTTLALCENCLNNLPKLPPNLSSLYMSFNKFEEIPNTVFDLKRLGSIDFSYNEIIQISDKIGDLPLLTHINFNHNYIESIPDTLFNLTELIDVQFQSNLLTTIPERMFNYKFKNQYDKFILDGNFIPQSLDSNGKKIESDDMYYNYKISVYCNAYNAKRITQIEKIIKSYTKC